MLDNHEDDEERPQKKKRKLSNSQENNNSNQDISFIKVPALYNGHCPKLVYFYITWIGFINILNLWINYTHNILLFVIYRTCWSHSPHQSASD